MRLNLDFVAKHLKCKPWREISDAPITSPDQILDHWIPPILPEMVREDFQVFFDNKLSGKIDWLRSCMDSSFTKFKVRFEPGGYRGVADFIEWDGKLDGQFLDRIIVLLQSIAKCTAAPLSVEQFWNLATELCKFTVFPLSSLDIHIIKAFSNMPMITIPALARLLGSSYKKTRSRWNRLRRLNICRILAQVNYQSLGLVPVFIELHDTNASIQSPYMLSYIELAGNVRRTLYFMAVPKERLTQLSGFLRSNFGTTYTLFLVEDVGRTVEFTHYKIDQKRWTINWQKLFIGAHLLHNRCLNLQPTVHDDTRPRTHRYYVPDSKDKRLIPLLAPDARIKLEKLAAIAGMSISQVSRRRSKLIELGVIQPTPLIRRIGLLEDVIIRVKENDERLLGIVNELPQAWIRQLTKYQTHENEFFVYTTLPPGSFSLIRYYLSKYIHTPSDVFITGPENGGWPLTFETFDLESCSWTWRDPIVVENAKIAAIDPRAKLSQGSWI
ncbi:MAG: AsnC family transcriptional regulator [Promethearchaeota archaeon]